MAKESIEASKKSNLEKENFNLIYAIFKKINSIEEVMALPLLKNLEKARFLTLLKEIENIMLTMLENLENIENSKIESHITKNIANLENMLNCLNEVNRNFHSMLIGFTDQSKNITSCETLVKENKILLEQIQKLSKSISTEDLTQKTNISELRMFKNASNNFIQKINFTNTANTKHKNFTF